MGLFILPFIDFLITSNSIRVQVILGLNSQVKKKKLGKHCTLNPKCSTFLKKMFSQDISGMKCFIYVD